MNKITIGYDGGDVAIWVNDQYLGMVYGIGMVEPDARNPSSRHKLVNKNGDTVMSLWDVTEIITEDG